MDKDFERIAARAAKLRLTERELVALVASPPMSWVAYWRAKSGITKLNGQVKIIRRVEALLAELESLPAICGLCDKRAIDPAVRSCTLVSCSMQRKEAA